MAIASKGVFHYLLFWGSGYPMVIKFPPKLLGAIVQVRVVVAHIGHSVVDHNCVKVIRPFLKLGVRLLESILKALDLLLELRGILLSF